jgi:hypothetical protein
MFSVVCVGVTGNTARSALSDEGELRLRFQPKRNAQFLSERSFRSRIRMSAPRAIAESCYSEGQVAKLAGLGVEQLRTLALYDVLNPTESGLYYTDLIVARAVGRLSGKGAAFPKIIAAALALEERGLSLSGVRLAEAPWGELVQVLDGAVAQVDGQLVLSLHDAFALPAHPFRLRPALHRCEDAPIAVEPSKLRAACRAALKREIALVYERYCS